MTTTADPEPRQAPATGELDLEVTSRQALADGVVLLTLQGHTGQALPPWEPGAHIDLVLSGGNVRQYSLCGDPGRLDVWQIAVRLDTDGRGGSLGVHRDLVTGTRVRARGPRNSFALQDSPRYLFLAGGIGITPLLPMVRVAASRGREVELVYAGRSLASMPFAHQLREELGDRVRLAPADTGERVDLHQVLGSPKTDTAVYCCGPQRFTDAVSQATQDWPPGSVRMERFAPVQRGPEDGDLPFEVECTLSGLVVPVHQDQTALEALESKGIFVNSSCREGTCGSCETSIVSGAADHRDSLLTEEERASNETMMVCVSRAAGARISLDL